MMDIDGVLLRNASSSNSEIFISGPNHNIIKKKENMHKI